MAAAAGGQLELLRNRAPGPEQRHTLSPLLPYRPSFRVIAPGSTRPEMPERLRLYPTRPGIAATAPPLWEGFVPPGIGRWPRPPIRWLAFVEPPPLCRLPLPLRKDCLAGDSRRPD